MSDPQQHTLQRKKNPQVLARNFSNRIALGTALTWSLARFHMAGWVHKKISTHNILFFQDIQAVANRRDGYSWGSPFLVGFELARHSLGFSDPQDRRPMEWKYRVYTHPQRLGDDKSQTFVKFTKRHDIYSMGVVLLELGILYLFTAPRFVNNPDQTKNLDKLSPSEVHQRFQKMAGSLAANMGNIYAEVTRRCLDADFRIDEAEDDAEDSLLTERYIMQVCKRMESIQI